VSVKPRIVAEDAVRWALMNELESIAQASLAIDGVMSAVIFVAVPAAGEAAPPPDEALELAVGGAAGIAGSALDGLVAAVRNPAHPVRRALDDPGPSFDVLPMNPGGPRLRSHLPIRTPSGTVTGVLAVAHDAALESAARGALEDLAARAATAISPE
jgi:hypothetical protein